MERTNEIARRICVPVATDRMGSSQELEEITRLHIGRRYIFGSWHLSEDKNLESVLTNARQTLKKNKRALSTLSVFVRLKKKDIQQQKRREK